MVKFCKQISESEGSDFSAGDDSDGFQPNDTAETDTADANSSDDEPISRKYVPPIIETQKPIVTSRMTRSAARKPDFILESDRYFSHQANKKVITDLIITFN